MKLRSIDSKSLLIQATLFPAHTNPIDVTSLVDCGCSARAFADRSFIKSQNITTQPTPSKRALLLADGKPAGTISEYFIARMSIGLHRKLCLFFVTDLSPDTPIILGLPWLQRHNPSIDWSKMSLTFISPYCHNFCCPLGTRNIAAPTIPDPPSNYHDLPISGEPARRVMFYRPLSVEDLEDDASDHSSQSDCSSIGDNDRGYSSIDDCSIDSIAAPAPLLTDPQQSKTRKMTTTRIFQPR